MSKLQLVFTVLAVIAVGAWIAIYKDAIFTRPSSGNQVQSIVASFLCKDSKSVVATFSANRVALALNDGRSMTLPHAVSADGARYANADESFVFWNRGNTAFITEGAQGTQTYSGCIVASAAPSGWVAYLNSTLGFTISHPDGYTVKDPFQYQALGPGKTISGVAFVIPESKKAGTNLSADSLVSVETLPNAKNCTADAFLPNIKTLAQVTDANVVYSVATSSDAAAGNRYNEVVYAIPGTNPCTAVRYFIHFGNIANYDPGTVKEFDQNALLNEFDTIRRSLILGR